MTKLKNKIAVITGGNSGIGLATAKLFKEEGATVIINARNNQRLEETKAQYSDYFDEIYTADVSKIDELERFFNTIGEKHGKIDILYLNAGVAYFMPIEDITEETFDTQFGINVKGVLFGVQKALPYLEKGSSVLLTTSVLNQMGMPNSSVYAATKGALRTLTKTIAVELLPKGIRVNAIAPGPIETPIFSKLGMEPQQLDEMAQGIISQVPLGRLGKSEEIAKTALFLASNDSSYFVGAELEIDGGMVTL
jgi:NAD(P)-dependent dehydrogenase (short-subunit alcohol dehydrogenase family)